MSKLNKLLIIIVVAWCLSQIICLICFWNIEQSFDSDYYLTQANMHAKLKMLYPTANNIFDTYIQSPGYINMLALLIFLTNGYKVMLILGILMNVGILFNIYYLANRFFSVRIAQYAVILYCVIPSNIFVSIWLVTELPYLFIGLTAFSLSLNRHTKYLILSGGLLAFAQIIRPIALSFLLCSLVYYLLNHYNIRRYMAILAPYTLFLFISGMYIKHNTGYFVTSSTVGGYDLMYTSYDGADGGQYPWYVFKEGGPGFIENEEQISFAEKDSIWKSRSIEWIKKHPLQYFSMGVNRLLIMYESDLWPIPGRIMNSLNNYLPLFFIKILLNIPYFLTLILSLLSVLIGGKDWLSDKGVVLFHIIVGTGATCLFGVMSRYHYPFVFVLSILAAYAIDKCITICTKRHY